MSLYGFHTTLKKIYALDITLKDMACEQVMFPEQHYKTMLCFSVNYALEIIQKIIMKTLHDGFLNTKIVTHIVLAMRKRKLKYYTFCKFFM